MAKIKLIVGLGNPGAEYAQTRHNAGAWYVESLSDSYQIALKLENRLFAYLGRGLIDGQDCRLLIPNTFMNLSGKAVAAVAQFYKIMPDEILVAHDELDIPAGTVKLKQSGGHGGHNGLKSIISSLANCRDFYRLRIGIDHPGDKSKVTNYVLSKASPDDRQAIEASISEALRYTGLIIKGEDQPVMRDLHAFNAKNNQ